VKPAYAEQFDPATLPRVRPLLNGGLISKDWAWRGSTGAGVRVAVVDSGIEDGHPAVGRVDGAVALSYDDDAPGGVRVQDGPHEDLFGHGTACAGIIRATAPDCELYSVRVLGERLTGRGTVFAAGVRWALDAGMHVVNLSLSTGREAYLPVLHEITDAAYFNRTMLVCAVNNTAGASYPAQFASVLSVAAHERHDPFGFDYNPTPPVEFGAPGLDVEVAWRGGGRLSVTGNSFAAAHLTGLVARLLGKHPDLTPFQVKTVLHAVADNAAGPPDARRDEGSDSVDHGTS
jgi:subtilisin family serine protease